MCTAGTYGTQNGSRLLLAAHNHYTKLPAHKMRDHHPLFMPLLHHSQQILSENLGSLSEGVDQLRTLQRVQKLPLCPGYLQGSEELSFQQAGHTCFRSL